MREPEFVPVVFTDDQVTHLVNWRPRGVRDRRLHLLVLLLLDTGARISEVLSLRVADIDFENFLLTLTGKGRKQRRVPFSLELRRTLFKWVRDSKQPQDSSYPTRRGWLWRETPASAQSNIFVNDSGLNRRRVHYTRLVGILSPRIS
jgi:integrase